MTAPGAGPVADPFSLRGRVALVTGAGGRLGRLFAQVLGMASGGRDGGAFSLPASAVDGHLERCRDEGGAQRVAALDGEALLRP